MTYLELFNLLKTLGIPIAYGHFNSTPTLPFMAIISDSATPFHADGINYYQTTDYTIEYYFEKKNLVKEKELESLLTSNGLMFDASGDIFISEQNIYQKNYEVNING